jgi:hypothetical protein
MPRFISATLLSACVLVLTCCLASASDDLPLEEQFQQLRDNYVNLLLLALLYWKKPNYSLVIKIADINEIRGLLAEKNKRQGELEIKLQQQQKSLSVIQQRNGPNSEAVVTETDSNSVGRSNAILRQGCPKIPRSCADVKANGHASSGIYSIIGVKSMESVYCDFSKTAIDPSKSTIRQLFNFIRHNLNWGLI